MYLNSIYSNSSGSNFIGNKAYRDNGGAICVREKSTYNYSPNCLFKENYASKSGGAIEIIEFSIYSNSENCTFDSNSVRNSHGGAIQLTFNSIYSISENCTFSNNS